MCLVGISYLLTDLTTAAGLGAMSLGLIKTLAHFAVYGAMGVVAADFLLMPP